MFHLFGEDSMLFQNVSNTLFLKNKMRDGPPLARFLNDEQDKKQY